MAQRVHLMETSTSGLGPTVACLLSMQPQRIKFMRIDLEVSSPAERARLLDCRLYDSVTGDQLTTVIACDTESGWRREYIETILGRWELVETLGNPLRVYWNGRASGMQYEVVPKEVCKAGSVDVIGSASR